MGFVASCRTTALAWVLPLLGITACRVVAAETALKTELGAGDIRLVRVALEVRGLVKMSGARGDAVNRRLAVNGEVRFDEKVLPGGPSESRRLTARHYDTVSATITMDGKATPKKSLNQGHRLILAAQQDHRTTLVAPRGPLSRDELDLLALPGDPLALESLLPEQAVGVGDRWEVAYAALAQIVGIDEVTLSDVTCELKKAQRDSATVEASGKLKGTAGGAATEIDLTAKYTFDFRHRQITWLAMSLKEKRAQGYVGPELDTAARIIVEVTPIGSSTHLTEEALAGVSLAPTPNSELLAHISVGKEFQFALAHDRRWHIVSDEPALVGLRLIEANELVAQLNISPMDRRAAGASLSLEEYQQQVKDALGESFGQFVTIAQQANARGYRVYRLEALGKTNDLEIVWIYYYIADREGRNVALVFTLESRLLEPFQKADRAIVESLVLADKPQSVSHVPVKRAPR